VSSLSEMPEFFEQIRHLAGECKVSEENVLTQRNVRGILSLCDKALEEWGALE